MRWHERRAWAGQGQAQGGPSVRCAGSRQGPYQQARACYDSALCERVTKRGPAGHASALCKRGQGDP